MLQHKHSFSIENNINEDTGKPFGPKYSGTFHIRRPTLADKRAITLRDGAALTAYGNVNPDLLTGGFKLLNYAYTFVSGVAEEKVPEWFDMDKLYDEEDEAAIFEVWKEVGKFLDTFRPA